MMKGVFRDSAGLKQLIVLYVARSHELWKDPVVMRWLETNAHALLATLEDKSAALDRFRQMCV